MAMAVKLYELGRIFSGTAAALVGMDRVAFLLGLHHQRYKNRTCFLNSIDDKINYNPAQLNALKQYQLGFLHQ